MSTCAALALVFVALVRLLVLVLVLALVLVSLLLRPRPALCRNRPTPQRLFHPRGHWRGEGRSRPRRGPGGASRTSTRRPFRRRAAPPPRGCRRLARRGVGRCGREERQQPLCNQLVCLAQPLGESAALRGARALARRVAGVPLGEALEPPLPSARKCAGTPNAQQPAVAARAGRSDGSKVLQVEAQIVLLLEVAARAKQVDRLADCKCLRDHASAGSGDEAAGASQVVRESRGGWLHGHVRVALVLSGVVGQPLLLDEEEDPPSRKLALERREHLRNRRVGHVETTVVEEERRRGRQRHDLRDGALHREDREGHERAARPDAELVQASHEQAPLVARAVAVDLALGGDSDEPRRRIHHVDDRGDCRLPEGEAVCGAVLLEEGGNLARELDGPRTRRLCGVPHDRRVFKRLAIVIVHLKVEIDKPSVREAMLERDELVGRDLLLLGERDDWEVDARLLEDGKHPLHLVQVAQTVSAARHEH
mmetsp:Transcript_24329/g.72532  ORF Transcript_24329/g.72532 Transcript_24329/m.72532 type:complete len:481 (-) Transcript_24329:211-1653(-)